MTKPTISEDITALLKSRHALLWIVTREEFRAERIIIEAAGKAAYETRCWDCASGLSDATETVLDARLRDPQAMLDTIGRDTTRCVYILRDMHKWFDPVVLRALKNLARKLQNTPRNEARGVIILSPMAEIPPELSGCTTVLEFPIPNKKEVEKILDNAIAGLPEELKATALTQETREQAIDAAVGLTAEEASNCYAKSLVTTRKIDIEQVTREKKRVIARERVLTWYDPDPRGLDAVGGLDNMKEWLTQRRSALDQRARTYGLPTPKGVILIGVPGCGKSLTAKAVAAAWQMPLLRLDMGGLKSKYVGESEGNIRKALSIAETIAPCVLWMDELEKALGGATGPQGDGGVASDYLGTILNWMQEKTASVFVVATANDVSALPPELLRKGRFDEIFFVDLPNKTERLEIVKTTLRQYGQDPGRIDCQLIAGMTQGWTGAEISQLIPDAMFVAFADNERPVTTEDIGIATQKVVPLSEMAAEKIKQLREWSSTRARPASREEAQVKTEKKRELDTEVEPAIATATTKTLDFEL